MKLKRQQCVLHPDRGAVARCPDCKRFYCHECITEHEGQVLCRRCLTRKVEEDENSAGFLQRHRLFLLMLGKPLLAAAGIILLWFIFVSIGAVLMRFPDSFYYSAPEKSGGRGAAFK